MGNTATVLVIYITSLRSVCAMSICSVCTVMQCVIVIGLSGVYKLWDYGDIGRFPGRGW